MLKRNSKLSFANYFAFPGGMIEKQDYVHKWQKNMPEYYSGYIGGVQRFPDFTKRMAVLRELFEECNLLVAKEKLAPYSGVAAKKEAVTSYRETYLKTYGGNFIKFCKNTKMYP